MDNETETRIAVGIPERMFKHIEAFAAEAQSRYHAPISAEDAIERLLARALNSIDHEWHKGDQQITKAVSPLFPPPPEA